MRKVFARLGKSILLPKSARASLVVKNLPAMQETWVHFLGWEDPLEKETGTHSSILAWRIPWAVYIQGHKELDMTERLSLYFFTS